MRVVKRSGAHEAVSFDKITRRLNKLAGGLRVDALGLAQKIVAGLRDGVTTTELDELAAEMAAGLAGTHPDYGKFAARIAISNLHKSVPATFAVVARRLRDYELRGEPAPLVTEKLATLAEEYADDIEEALDHARDANFDYFGFKTLERSYLLRVDGKVAERPQHLFMRVALGIHGGDIASAIATYHDTSRGLFTHASPTLFNSATPRAALSSCFLLTTEDSIEGIYSTISECAAISKSAGGIGVAVHDIRASGSYIRGTNGFSNGLVPALRVFDATARYVDQGGGKRKGAFAMYVEPSHPDVFQFLDMRKNRGAEELRARDLFYAMWIPDLFMRRVEADAPWTLMCPDKCPGLADVHGAEYDALYERYEREGRGNKTIKARELWTAILDSQVESGTPYLLYKDSANRHSNQKNLGTIRSSNLCVAGDTRILTSAGYHPIASLESQKVSVWNGREFSETTVRKTGENKKLLTVAFSNGTILRCTPYHKFYVEMRTTRTNQKSRVVVIEAKDLTPGDKIPHIDYPIITGGADTTLDTALAYTHGAYCGDGFDHRGRGKSYIDVSRADKITAFTENLSYTSVISMKDTSRPPGYNQQKTRFTLVDGIPRKYYVPTNAPIQTRLRWLEGYLDADGCVVTNKGLKHIQAASVEHGFIDDVRLMLQITGVNARISHAFDGGRVVTFPGGRTSCETRDCYKLIISNTGLKTLASLGFAPKRLDISGDREQQRRKQIFVRVVDIQDCGDVEDTFCFNEPKRHAGVFEGVYAGQCAEILEYTSDKETSVCNLASIAVNRFVRTEGSAEPHERLVGSVGSEDRYYDFAELHRVAKHVARNLNKVIDVNYYPSEKARYSNLKNRPIGIGVQGLADAFATLGLPFDSIGAADLNAKIAEVIYHGALEASCELAEELGPYESYAGSPVSKGVLHHDSFGGEEDPELALDWAGLRARIARHGVRNSLLVALMPTASTASILGNNESFEPFTSNVYTRRVLSGEFVMANRHLMADLCELGVWGPAVKSELISANGSVQGIAAVPDKLKALYKTVWEIGGRVMIDLSAARQAFVDQSQSFNCFMADPTHAKLTSYHFYAWKKGLVTGSYYVRIKAPSQAIKFTQEATSAASSAAAKKTVAEEAAILACSLENPESCMMCSG